MSLKEQRYPGKPRRGSARQPRWKPLARGLHPQTRLRPWLEVKTSLTRKLEELHGPVRVVVLRQSVGLPLRDEATRPLVPCVIRDVVLKDSTDQILVLAHSILPLAPRGAFHPWLRRLGRQALGSLLFVDPGFVRRQREWALLDHRHPLYRQARTVCAGQLPPKVWARRACFSQLRRPAQTVQVTELFLNVKNPA